MSRDHTAEALAMLARIREGMSHIDAHVILAGAQVHATLALAEQPAPQPDQTELLQAADALIGVVVRSPGRIPDLVRDYPGLAHQLTHLSMYATIPVNLGKIARSLDRHAEAAPERRTGVDLIAAERQRQTDAEGWTADHDAQHTDGDLAVAAACYAIPAAYRAPGLPGVPPAAWPWAAQSWRPTPGDRARELVKAGALIAAEIDRLNAAGGEG